MIKKTTESILEQGVEFQLDNFQTIGYEIREIAILKKAAEKIAKDNEDKIPELGKPVFVSNF